MDYKDIQNYLGGDNEMFHMGLRPGISFPYGGDDDDESVEMFLRKFTVDKAVEVGGAAKVEEVEPETEMVEEVEPEEEIVEEVEPEDETIEEVEPEEETIEEVEPEEEIVEEVEPELKLQEVEPKVKSRKPSSASGLLLVGELVKKYKESHHTNK